MHQKKYWVVISNILYFCPYLEKIPILINIFQPIRSKYSTFISNYIKHKMTRRIWTGMFSGNNSHFFKAMAEERTATEKQKGVVRGARGRKQGNWRPWSQFPAGDGSPGAIWIQMILMYFFCLVKNQLVDVSLVKSPNPALFEVLMPRTEEVITPEAVRRLREIRWDATFIWWLGGGNSNMFLYMFTPTWGNDPIWRSFFSNGLIPSTRISCCIFFCILHHLTSCSIN